MIERLNGRQKILSVEKMETSSTIAKAIKLSELTASAVRASFNNNNNSDDNRL